MCDFVSIIVKEKIDFNNIFNKSDRILFEDISQRVINIKVDKFYYVVSAGSCSCDFLNPFMNKEDYFVKELFEILHSVSMSTEVNLFIVEDNGTLDYIRDLQFMIDHAQKTVEINISDLQEIFPFPEKFVLYKINVDKSEKLDSINIVKEKEIKKYLQLSAVKSNKFIHSFLALNNYLINNNKFINVIINNIIKCIDLDLPADKIQEEIYNSKEYIELTMSELNREKRIETIKKKISEIYNYNDPYYNELIIADNIARSFYANIKEILQNLEYEQQIESIKEYFIKYSNNSSLVNEKIFILSAMGFQISIIELACILSTIGVLCNLEHALRSDYFISLLSGVPIYNSSSEIDLIINRLQDNEKNISKIIEEYFGKNSKDIFLNGLGVGSQQNQ